MAIFSKKPSTLEEVRRAYENLSEDDKKSFHQSISDRIHESVAAQEREHGQEDSQSAEAREHEALGEEHADGKGDVEELHEKDDTAEERAEDSVDKRKEGSREEPEEENKLDDRYAALGSKLDRLSEMFEKYFSKSSETTDAEEKAAEVYGLGNGVFVDKDDEKKSEKINKEDVAKIISKLMR